MEKSGSCLCRSLLGVYWSTSGTWSCSCRKLNWSLFDLLCSEAYSCSMLVQCVNYCSNYSQFESHLCCVQTNLLFTSVPSSNVDAWWHIHQAISSPVCMEIPHSAPPPPYFKPAYRSIPTTIEIVIDLPQPGPVAIRSHLRSMPLLERQTQLALPAKVLGAVMFAWRHVSCIVSLWWMEQIVGTHLLQRIPPAHQWVEIGFVFVSEGSWYPYPFKQFIFFCSANIFHKDRSFPKIMQSLYMSCSALPWSSHCPRVFSSLKKIINHKSSFLQHY